MRVTRQQAAANREKVLDVAGTLFRERGFDGIGVADIMKRAGLTHGGFYAHFASKDDLLAEALRHGRRQTNERFESFDSLQAVVDSYLDPAHAAHPERGCAIPSLGLEISRSSPKARRRLAGAIRARVARLGALLPRRLSGAERERQAIGAFACMVGGLLLARASDPDDRDRILAACREFLHDATELDGDTGSTRSNGATEN